MRFKKSLLDEKSFVNNIVVGGEAGEGIKFSGNFLAITLIKKGFNVISYDEYPSLIRGGHNMVSVNFSPFPVYAPNHNIDILVCLNRETFDIHKNKLNFSSLVILDESVFKLTEDDLLNLPCEVIDIDVNLSIKRLELPSIYKNTIFIGAILNILGVEKKISLSVLRKFFRNKVDALQMNIKALEAGYKSSDEYADIRKIDLNKKNIKNTPSYFLSGNEAIGIGALKAGIGFFAAYPMTPSSTLLDFMIQNYSDYNYIVKQSEDEISAINMAIGASFTGARSMVGTSGGGFSLMVEGLGLAAITETPVVIMLSQRPGPATGLPTWTSQSDLLFVSFASQDEFPRIILTPTDIEECISLSFQAFNLADKFQVPVFILMDKYLSESMSSISMGGLDGIDGAIDRGLMIKSSLLQRIEDFKRYEFTDSGLSPRTVPGQQGGIFLANSDESDEYGFSSEDQLNRMAKVRKRFKKVPAIWKAMPELNVYGDIKSKIGFISWGSTKGVILEAMRRLQKVGIKTKLFALNYVDPFPSVEIENFLNRNKVNILIENNFTSQLGQLINKQLGIDLDYALLKYDGRPIFPEDIIKFLVNIK